MGHVGDAAHVALCGIQTLIISASRYVPSTDSPRYQLAIAGASTRALLAQSPLIKRHVLSCQGQSTRTVGSEFDRNQGYQPNPAANMMT